MEHTSVLIISTMKVDLNQVRSPTLVILNYLEMTALGSFKPWLRPTKRNTSTNAPSSPTLSLDPDIDMQRLAKANISAHSGS